MTGVCNRYVELQHVWLNHQCKHLILTEWDPNQGYFNLLYIQSLRLGNEKFNENPHQDGNLCNCFFQSKLHGIKLGHHDDVTCL